MEKHLNVPANTEELAELKSGDYVYLTGTIYTARDAAHKRMYETLLDGKELPVDVKGQFIYYLGPTPAREGQVIGSAGPTTSSRMDKYTPTMLDQGLKGMIGKGKRSSEVIESIKQNGAVYFAAVGGAGALLSKCIKEAEVIAYDDLGTEAIRKLRVENFPVIVVIDNQGNNLYETAVENFKKLNLEYNSTGVKSESTIRNLQSPAAQICAMYKITDIIRDVKILITESRKVSTPKSRNCKMSNTIPSNENGNR